MVPFSSFPRKVACPVLPVALAGTLAVPVAGAPVVLAVLVASGNLRRTRVSTGIRAALDRATRDSANATPQDGGLSPRSGDQTRTTKFVQEDGTRAGRWRDLGGRFTTPPSPGDEVISQAEALPLGTIRSGMRNHRGEARHSESRRDHVLARSVQVQRGPNGSSRQRRPLPWRC